MTDRVQCIRCDKRSNRAHEDCACYELCSHSGYGYCSCGGQFYPVETIRRWREFDRLTEKEAPSEGVVG